MLSNSPLQTILDLLEGVKHANDGYSARCPAHDDQRNSLSIDLGNDGRVLLYCHAGCSSQDICKAVGLEMRDLFAPNPVSNRWRIAATYDYRDENGSLLYQKVRYEPKDFRCRVPDGNGGWHWKMNGVRRVLYRLPEVIESPFVFIAEGEKDCDLLAGHGYAATCNYDGAGKWDSNYNRFFADKVVFLLPDNDEPGRKHAATIYQQIRDITKDCRIVQLPGLRDKGDVSDYFANGGTVEQFNDAVAAAEEPDESFEAAESKPETASGGSVDGWGAVVPFDDMDLPGFPLEAMPGSLSFFSQVVREVSNSHQTPEDMTALLLMTVAAGCLGGTVKIFTNNRYTELATLFTAIFAPSGTRKSSVYHALMKPVIDYQQQLRADMRAKIEGNKNELDILKKQIEKLKKDIVKSGDDQAQALRDDLKDKEQAVAEFSKPVELPLIYMETDFTVESLAPKIQANGGTLSLFDHEGAFWNEVAGRYTQGQSQTNDLILKSYDGHPVTVSRVGRGDIFIERCCLAVGLIVQPTKIEELKQKKSLDETGLIPRFILAVPVDTVGYRKMQTPGVPHHVYDDYNSRIEKLLGLRQYSEIVLKMDSKTVERFMRYCESVEVRLREGRDLYSMRAWASKLPGRIARIAAVLHCFANPSVVPDNPVIDAEIMAYAIGLSEYLIAHAKATYQILNLSADVKIARKLLRTLENYAAEKKVSRISKGDLWRRIKNSDKSVQTVASVAGALEILIDHNYIRQVEAEHRPGRPAEIYELNPAHFHPTNPINSLAG